MSVGGIMSTDPSTTCGHCGGSLTSDSYKNRVFTWCPELDCSNWDQAEQEVELLCEESGKISAPTTVYRRTFRIPSSAEV